MSACLRDLMLGDASPLTCRSYAFDLLRWHRLLWCLGVGWEKATEADVATLVGWLRAARNPQRERRRPGSAPAGSVNLKTGKPSLRTGYAPATINHALTVVHGFYSFHGRFGDGPVMTRCPCPPSAGWCWRTAAAGAGSVRPAGAAAAEGAAAGPASDPGCVVGWSCSRRWGVIVTGLCWSSMSAPGRGRASFWG